MNGPCLCGDLYCGSCGPAQGNTKCSACGEWMEEHDEHIYVGLDLNADEIMAYLKSLAGGVSPFDYHTIRTSARNILANIQHALVEAAQCKHDDARCEEQNRLAAETEAKWLEETERAADEWERTNP